MYGITIKEINERALKAPESFIEDCEKRFAKAVSKAAALIRENNIKYVFLSGPSSSGKTTFTRKFSAYFKDLHYVGISLDDYYRPIDEMPRRKNGVRNYETIHSLRTDVMIKDFEDLINGGEIRLPDVYFSGECKGEAGETIRLQGDDLVVIEGLHALNPKIYNVFNRGKILKLFIYPAPAVFRTESSQNPLSRFDLRFLRRMIRDYYYRSSDVENSMDMWEQVRAGENIYMHKYEKDADMVIDTFLNYEPCILKRFGEDLLNAANKDGVHSLKKARLLNILSLFEELPISMLPDHSVLNEFVKRQAVK